MSLSSVNEIQSTVRRNSDDFSYVKTIASLINNREFSQGYNEFVTGKSTTKTYIWEVLSAIGDDVGQIIYENVLNYVDDISNIDLCRTKPLRSILSSFGLDYSVLNNIDLLPLEILNVLDVLSINKKYLLNEKVLGKGLIEEIRSQTYVKGKDTNDISNDISGVTDIIGYVDDDKYESFLSSIYKNLIDGIIKTKYGIGTEYPIYRTYGQYLTQDTFIESDITNDEAYQLKVRSNIDSSFDEGSILDKINSGEDSLDNYQGVYKTLIEMEQKKREKPYNTLSGDTRYAYYKEQKVSEYFSFLKNKFNNTNQDSKNKEYVLDDNYFEINQDSNLCLLMLDGDGGYELTKSTDVPEGVYSYDKVLDSVVSELVYITRYISKLREELKLSLQKSHMKGTFNLLSYVINEYLMEFAKSNKTYKNHPQAIATVKKRIKGDTSIIEYYDTTEYFNISTDNSSKAKNKKYVNDRYWEENEESTNSNSGFAFAKEEIENFYNNILNVKNKTSDLMKFLNTIYESGANRSYIEADTDQVVISTTSALFEDSSDLFERFTGDKDNGLMPQMNHKNKTHPSYQVHPFLFNFIEASNYNYPVVNSFYNDLNEELEDEEVLANIKNTIGEFGETINIAMENLYDYSGYKSRYESSPHESATGARISKYDVIDYDGAFYPDAVSAFLNDEEVFISSLQNKTGDYYKKYYEHLNLNQREINHICEQLSTYYADIKEKAETKYSVKDVWDIYKYGRDAYDNMYILYKKYDEENPSFKTKKNTKGQLWIRLKDHPIAFPALNGSDPQIDTRTDYYNNLFDSIIDGKILSTADECFYFYDMEFDSTKQYIFMSYYPVHSLSSFIPSFKKYDRVYDTYQNASMIACKITEEYDKDVGYNRLQLNSNRDTKLEGYDNLGMMQVGTTGTAFLGFYKNGNNTGLVYVNKYLSCDEDYNPIYSIPDETKLDLTFVIFTKLNSYKTYTGSIPTNNPNYKLKNADVHFGYHEDQLDFVFPVQVETQISNYQNYLGKAAVNSDSTLSSYGNVDYEEDSKGDPIFDTSKPEMNSLDKIEECIGCVETYLEGSLLKTIGDIKLYNLNGDPSYIPTYPGSIGTTDASRSYVYRTRFKDKQYLTFELLGRSKNIDAAIAMVDPNADVGTEDTVEETLNKLKDLIYGRIYEDYVEDDGSLRIYTNNTLYSTLDEDIIEWNIPSLLSGDPMLSGGEDKEGRYLSSMEIVIYNTQSAGKNPFYMGLLSSLSGQDFKTLEYMEDEDIETAEVSVGGYDNIYVAGTYDFYSHQFNRSDYNTILGIKGLSARYYNGSLDIKFQKSQNINMFIPYRTVDCVVLNSEDIRMFERYHYIDEKCCINDNISIDINGKEVDPRTYVVDGDRIINLSGFYLSSYNALSDIPFMSGDQNLTFKYDESPIFEKGTKMYYLPGFNTSYPQKMRDTYTGSLTDFRQSSDLFDQKNLFIVKCDSDSLLSSFGKINIPLLYTDTNAIRVFEEFLSGDFQSEFDSVDIRTIQSSKLYENDETKWDDINNYTLTATLNPNDYSEETDKIWRVCSICPMKVESGALTESSESIVFKASDLKEYIRKLSKFLNIYVNYKKNSDEKLTLYFNYINYLNTPFLKIVGSSIKIDTITNTYLKLNSGEDGVLDIMIQLKYYYDDRKLYGYKNIKLLSYHIYNISDDKPKFLVYKEASI